MQGNFLKKRSALAAAACCMMAAACSDDAVMAPAPEAPPEEAAPDPGPVTVSPNTAAGMLGTGFSLAFFAGAEDEPLDPMGGDIVPLDPAGEPIDISNTN